MPATRLNAFQAVCVMIMTALASLAEACRLPVNTYFGHGGHACRHGSGNSRCRARNGTRRHGLWRILLIAALALTRHPQQRKRDSTSTMCFCGSDTPRAARWLRCTTPNLKGIT